MTYIVSLKTHDIGIRLALGAPRAVILQMMVKRGLVLISSGIVIGLVTSYRTHAFPLEPVRGISATVR